MITRGTSQALVSKQLKSNQITQALSTFLIQITRTELV